MFTLASRGRGDQLRVGLRLLLTGAALAAAVLGLGGSLLLTFRARRALAAAMPGRSADMLTGSDRTIRAFRTAADLTKKSVAVDDVAPIAALAPARASRVPASAGS